MSNDVVNLGETFMRCREGVFFCVWVECSSVSSIEFITAVGSSISLFSFCLADLSFGEYKVLKCPTISV